MKIVDVYILVSDMYFICLRVVEVFLDFECILKVIIGLNMYLWFVIFFGEIINGILEGNLSVYLIVYVFLFLFI